MPKIKHKTNKAKRNDSTCKNNNSCPWCRGNRLHAKEKPKVEADEQISSYWNDRCKDQLDDLKNLDNLTALDKLANKG